MPTRIEIYLDAFNHYHANLSFRERVKIFLRGFTRETVRVFCSFIEYVEDHADSQPVKVSDVYPCLNTTQMEEPRV